MAAGAQLQSRFFFKDFSQLICRVVCVCASSSSSFDSLCVMTSLLPMGVGRHARNKSPVGLGVGEFSRSVLITMSTLPNLLLRRHLLTLPHSPPPPFPDIFKEKDYTDTTGRVRPKRLLLIPLNHKYSHHFSFVYQKIIFSQRNP